MLVPLPDILIGKVSFGKNDWELDENASDEQRKAFEQFLKESDRETITIKI